MGEGEGFLAKSVLLANVNSKTRFVYAHACVCVSARECARKCSDTRVEVVGVKKGSQAWRGGRRLYL